MKTETTTAPLLTARWSGSWRKRIGTFIAVGVIVSAGLLQDASVSAGAGPAPISISQVPLTVAIPAHPQVAIALANSESMDGDLSGAIMTGSGAFTGAEATFGALANSSSPVNYNIPAGFHPEAVTEDRSGSINTEHGS